MANNEYYLNAGLTFEENVRALINTATGILPTDKSIIKSVRHSETNVNESFIKIVGNVNKEVTGSTEYIYNRINLAGLDGKFITESGKEIFFITDFFVSVTDDQNTDEKIQACINEFLSFGGFGVTATVKHKSEMLPSNKIHEDALFLITETSCVNNVVNVYFDINKKNAVWMLAKNNTLVSTLKLQAFLV